MGKEGNLGKGMNLENNVIFLKAKETISVKSKGKDWF